MYTRTHHGYFTIHLNKLHAILTVFVNFLFNSFHLQKTPHSSKECGKKISQSAFGANQLKYSCSSGFNRKLKILLLYIFKPMRVT